MDASDLFRKAIWYYIETTPGVNQTTLAESLKLSRSEMNDFLHNRKNFSEKRKWRISEHLGKPYEEFLAMGRRILSGDPPEPKPPQPPEGQCLIVNVQSEDERAILEGRTEDYRGVPLYESGKLAASIKGLVFDLYEEPASTVVIYRLELKGREGHDLRALRVGGDSMWPVIPQGSIVVVDLDDREFVDKRLYVIMQEEAGLMVAAVKRIRKGKQGFVILSENREYLPEVTDIDWPDLCGGRVVWMWRSLEEA